MSRFQISVILVETLACLKIKSTEIVKTYEAGQGCTFKFQLGISSRSPYPSKSRCSPWKTYQCIRAGLDHRRQVGEQESWEYPTVRSLQSPGLDVIIMKENQYQITMNTCCEFCCCHEQPCCRHQRRPAGEPQPSQFSPSQQIVIRPKEKIIAHQ